MATTSATSIKVGAGFFGAVFLVLLGLKLIGFAPVAARSWWLVTSPLWGPWVLLLLVVVLGVAWAMFIAWLRKGI